MIVIVFCDLTLSGMLSNKNFPNKLLCQEMLIEIYLPLLNNFEDFESEVLTLCF